MKNYELYPLGEIHEKIIHDMGKLIVYNFAIGKSDLSGEDCGEIFAKAINAEHLNKPLGLADVVLEKMAWSVKSVKNNSPHTCKKVRVISGRCSPDYSYNISNPHEDIEATGRAVLGIWNERINIAKDKFEPLRSLIIIRNTDKLEFTIFENELNRFNVNEYLWQKNANGNFEGIRIADSKHVFTWQPHGSQFTIIYDITNSAKSFKIKKPKILNFEKVLEDLGYEDSWVTLVDNKN